MQLRVSPSSSFEQTIEVNSAAKQIISPICIGTPKMEMPRNQVVTDSKPLTTFVQVDTKSFKEVVQRLTGPSEIAADTVHEVTTAKSSISIKKPVFKLHERRQYKAKLEIIKPSLNFKPGTELLQQLQSPEQQRFSPSRTGNGVLLSSPLSTPTKCFSNLSLVERESSGDSAVPDLNKEEEEKAIRERRFYLHPSPRSKPGFSEPELLSLFPLTSPEAGKQTLIGQRDRHPLGRDQP